jgi:hypothetical protein
MHVFPPIAFRGENYSHQPAKAVLSSHTGPDGAIFIANQLKILIFIVSGIVFVWRRVALIPLLGSANPAQLIPIEGGANVNLARACCSKGVLETS